MRLLFRNVLVPKPVEWMQLVQMKMEKRRLILKNVFSCGQCLVNCPFGAISDKSQIFQVIRAMQSGERVYAALAPAFVGQFGAKVTPGKLRSAMKMLGFADIFEVAIGADLCATQEAEDFVQEVPNKLRLWQPPVVRHGLLWQKIVSGIQRVYFYGIDSNDAYSKAD